MGMKVEERHIPLEELDTFEEIGACGTAAVCSPVSEIDDLDTGKKYVISTTGEAGPVTTALYKKILAIQHGEEPDVHNWCEIID